MDVLLLLCYGSFPYRRVLFQTRMSVLFFVSGGVSTSRIWGVPQEELPELPRILCTWKKALVCSRSDRLMDAFFD